MRGEIFPSSRQCVSAAMTVRKRPREVWSTSSVKRASTTSPGQRPESTSSDGEHKVEKSVALGLSRFAVTVFLRPVRRKLLRLAVHDANQAPLAEVDFALVNNCRIERQRAQDAVEIVDTGFLYGNGFFRCDLAIAVPERLLSAIISVGALDESGNARYRGAPDRGFMINLASVRALG